MNTDPQICEALVLGDGPKHQVLHVNRFGEKTLASPALVDGRWYWRTEEVRRQEVKPGLLPCAW